MGFRTTNGELAVLLQGLEKSGDERHVENVKRLDRIIEQAMLTNSRVNKLEATAGKHWLAIGIIGAASLSAFGALVYKAFL